LLRKWNQDIGPQIGVPPEKIRLLNGSIGAPESTIVMEVTLADLAELNATWEKLATIPAHAQHAEELEPFIVSGTNRWEVYRVL